MTDTDLLLQLPLPERAARLVRLAVAAPAVVREALDSSLRMLGSPRSGDLITQAMTATGLSARALADLVGANERTMRRWQVDTVDDATARLLLVAAILSPQLVMDTLGVHPRPPGWMVSAAQRTLDG